jgi:hypothetical protein
VFKLKENANQEWRIISEDLHGFRSKNWETQKGTLNMFCDHFSDAVELKRYVSSGEEFK